MCIRKCISVPGYVLPIYIIMPHYCLPTKDVLSKEKNVYEHNVIEK